MNYQNCSFQQVKSRARMFSPSSLVPNVQQFHNRVLISRKIGLRSDQSSSSDNSDIHLSPKKYINLHQYEQMKNFHKRLIQRTTKLVNIAKISKYGGLFASRKLRNRIKSIKEFEYPLSPQIKSRHLSPWWQIKSLPNNEVVMKNSNIFQKDRMVAKSPWVDKRKRLLAEKFVSFKIKRNNLNIQEDEFIQTIDTVNSKTK